MNTDIGGLVGLLPRKLDKNTDKFHFVGKQMTGGKSTTKEKDIFG